MHLGLLWERHCGLLVDPVQSARKVNDELSQVVKGDSFATGLCGVIDAARRALQFVSADYPATPSHVDTLREPLLVYSIEIRLADDHAFVEVRFQSHHGAFTSTRRHSLPRTISARSVPSAPKARLDPATTPSHRCSLSMPLTTSRICPRSRAA